MSLNERVFIIVPLIASIFNIFLLLTVASVKKNRMVRSFMELLLTFTAWSLGSLLMRMNLLPSPSFWYMVSITGIFLVPFFLYNFIYYYTNSRGYFLRGVLLVSWIIIAVMNLSNVFIINPQIVFDGSERRFEYGVSPLLALPVALAVFTILIACYLIYRSCKEGNISISQFFPLFVGVFIMFFGTVAAAFPQMVSLPVDTFSCTINAICIYYMLYKRRVVHLEGVVSNEPIYAVSVLCSVLIMVGFHDRFSALYHQLLPDYAEYDTIVTSVIMTLGTLWLYQLFHWLMANLLTKKSEERELRLREFSTAASKTLKLTPLLQLYCGFLQENLRGHTARVFLRDSASGNYQMRGTTDVTLALKDSFAADHPLIQWLSAHPQAISYGAFRRTQNYRAMWAKEKQRLQEMDVAAILPICNNNRLVAVTLISALDHSRKNRTLSARSVTFLESTSAVFSIALNNATMYEELKYKAQRDPLTSLYNRRFFRENLEKEFAMSKNHQISLMIISFDDFHLYNELYGTGEGDRILKKFAHALEHLVGERGTVARYNGKEFVASFPMCTASVAQEYARRAQQWLQAQVADAEGKVKKHLTLSAGISAYPTDAASIDELFTYASMALFTAKNNGKNRIVLYSRQTGASDSAESYKNKRALADTCASTIYALTAAIDAKDHYTFNHSNNVAEFASILAKELKLDAEHVEIIRQAGLLHDIGKISTPEAILVKQSRLTPEEYAIIQQHVDASISMIKYLPSLDYVIPSVLGHHERWDGKGYPRGLAGNQIPLGARCLCLVDSFDAMMSRRSYKQPMEVEDAIAEIRRNLGTQFDPQIGQVFIQLVENGTISIQRYSTQ